MSFEKFDISNGRPRPGMQVTLEGGPFHGEVVNWGNGRYYEQAMLEGTAAAVPPLSDNAPEWFPRVRRVVYELDRWNEAHTAGVAKCIDDGKPKCKNIADCIEMSKVYRDTRAYYRSRLLQATITVTSRCPACNAVLAFGVGTKTT